MAQLYHESVDFNLNESELTVNALPNSIVKEQKDSSEEHQTETVWYYKKYICPIKVLSCFSL